LRACSFREEQTPLEGLPPSNRRAYIGLETASSLEKEFYLHPRRKQRGFLTGKEW